MTTDTLFDALDRRTEGAKEAAAKLGGAEDLIFAFEDAKTRLSVDALHLLMSAIHDSVTQGKRALQTCYWAEDDIKKEVVSLRDGVAALEVECDRLQATNEVVEQSFKRFSAFVNWVVKRGHAETNPTAVMCGTHESCPEQDRPTAAEQGTCSE